jgi:hypothetical protein
MEDLLLDSSGDITITDDDLVLSTGLDSVRQRIKMRLRMFKGEIFIDTALGTPHFDSTFARRPDLDLMKSVYRKVIGESEGVVELVSLTVELPSTRILSVKAEVLASDGQRIVLVDTLDLGDL